VDDFAKFLSRTLDSHTMKECLDEDQMHVFARHGKTSHLGVWSLRDLVESNGNLVEVDPQRSDPLDYVIPEGGLEEGLRNRVIVVSSKQN